MKQLALTVGISFVLAIFAAGCSSSKPQSTNTLITECKNGLLTSCKVLNQMLTSENSYKHLLEINTICEESNNCDNTTKPTHPDTPQAGFVRY